MREPFPLELPDPWQVFTRWVKLVAMMCLSLGIGTYFASLAYRQIHPVAAHVETASAESLTQTPAPPPTAAEELKSAVDAGQYDRALQLAASLTAAHPDDQALRTLGDQLQRDFTPKFAMRCIRANLAAKENAQRDKCETLSPDDQFYIDVDLSAVRPSSYAYMFLVDSSGNWKVLLPNNTYRNPLLPATYKVPDDLDFKKKLQASNAPGVETVFLVIAWWPIPTFDDLSARLAREADPQAQRALGDQIFERIRLEQKKPINLTGLKVGTLTFTSSGRS